jgi:hypothetical protein
MLMLCEIRVQGHLSANWSAWFDGLKVTNRDNGEAVLAGSLPDQAALLGVLNRLHGLNVRLLSVNCTENSPVASSFGE